MLNLNNNASLYFNENWKKYQETIKNNTIYHREMFSTLDAFISQYYNKKPFSLADFGCGDSSAIASVLQGSLIQKYIGIDAAKDIITLAADNLSSIHCEKDFICGDMLNSIALIQPSIDIIFTSYALHHLSLSDKEKFIRACKEKLTDNGYLVMIDGVRKNNQTRHDWLEGLKARFKETWGGISDKEIEIRMEHPRADDYPESIETFEKIAQQQEWKTFQVLFETKISAFVVFTKKP